MKRILNKKGISPIIATILLILITVAAAGIIWKAVIPMINKSLSKVTVGQGALEELEIVTDNVLTCTRSTNTSVQIRKIPGDVEITRIKIIVTMADGTTNYTIITNSSTPSMPSDNNVKAYTVYPGNVTSVAVAPFTRVGNTANDEEQEIAQQVNVMSCK